MNKRIINRYQSTLPGRCMSSVLGLALGLGIAMPIAAAPTYSINKVLVDEDQHQGESGVIPKPIAGSHVSTIFQMY